MAYTPNTWKSGDIVTSAKLNNIEQGIASSAFPITIDDSALSEKAGDIMTAALNGAYVYIVSETGFYSLAYAYIDLDNGYAFGFILNGGDVAEATAASADDYPILT